jgi:predicted phosphodiesterase
MSDHQSFEDYQTAKATAPEPKNIPRGWEPGLEWRTDDTGFVTVVRTEAEGPPDPAIMAEVIKDWGLNPDLTEIIDGSILLKGWDANLGRSKEFPNGNVQRFISYRVGIRRKATEEDLALIEELRQLVNGYQPRPPVFLREGSKRSLIFVLSDWQTGKGEGGGTDETLKRILRAFDELNTYLSWLTDRGELPNAIYVVGLGDLVEGCDGFYAMQTFQVDRNRRQQIDIVSRLLIQLVNMLVEFPIAVVCLAVPGNHGENRRKGKAFTDFSDNDDLAVFDILKKVCEGNPDRFANVYFPEGGIANDLTVTMDVSGVPCGFIHGHQCGGSKYSQATLENWWLEQMAGLRPVAAARILFSGHLHHFVVSERLGRTIIQVPAMDGGSQWWVERRGQTSPPGAVLIGVGEGYGPRGWGDLMILGQTGEGK